MPIGYIHKCSICAYTIRTSGLWEFYWDSDGHLKPYGHPSPTLQEAKDAGIHGLHAFLYCTNCEEVRRIIVLEFESPARAKDYHISSDGSPHSIPQANLFREGYALCKPIEGSKRRAILVCPSCNNARSVVEFQAPEVEDMPSFGVYRTCLNCRICGHTDIPCIISLVPGEHRWGVAYQAHVYLNQPKQEYTKPTFIRCPTCSSTDLILGPPAFGEPSNECSCPVCLHGKLIGQTECGF